jgi:hypothetical protein
MVALFVFPHWNVCSSQSYVSRKQRRLCSGSAQARLTFGSQVCSPLLRDAAQLRITLLEIINYPNAIILAKGELFCYCLGARLEIADLLLRAHGIVSPKLR